MGVFVEKVFRTVIGEAVGLSVIGLVLLLWCPIESSPLYPVAMVIEAEELKEKG